MQPHSEEIKVVEDVRFEAQDIVVEETKASQLLIMPN
jgi:hypothetical protein